MGTTGRSRRRKIPSRASPPQPERMTPRASYKSIAAGRPADEWLGRDVILDLCESLSLLEDEWSLFA